ncbi:SAM-dependent methyltransferase [Clostridium botulinum]|uniref:site-specific DNA-methyltransferase (adenine-specific) n=1 Tax=Clostridium botulinum TaxID=1491 RepID=A0A846J4N2_CLOBO|nr:N-6 DNA methylase [Clostridium botulinum]ACA57075.1 putative site-specific DNA-methyltransferase restriction-modification protein [Clostridium botulinum A3 str. Loch Maree]NFH64891.1 SAM-dependent methyltransferase [Clostridium botulinum]NFJ08909.1 SAM-dependent methyltransferase [Clostridium botulinum]NFK16177.1 SAM-dependent methyltransferase [Clostridium botulinum]NFM92522.1 SAM-dependent methyltransferase [Clostridium botulinum]
MNKKCQVFTPSDKVVELLDRVGYVKDLYGKKVIENACGNGNILKVIVDRYIRDSLSANIPIQSIKLGLESDIYGAEIDKEHYIKCIENLDLVANKYDIHNVSWKILNVDILKERLQGKFDYVIGNPPYITYRDLDNQTRKFVKENYEVCAKGKFDYCYAFIEASIKCLNNNGKLAYLIPSSIFKNVFAQRLRDYMLKYLCKIYDYKTKRVFKNVVTSSAIIILDKGNESDEITYSDIAQKVSWKIKKFNLTGKWVFKRKVDNKTSKKARFDDYFSASMSIATLLNEAFIISEFEEFDQYIITNKYIIEKEVLRVAASPRNLAYNKKQWIIYPYYYNENNLNRYTEEEFIRKFPNAAKYLRTYYEKLINRKAEKNVRWYEYGRGQAILHLNQPKLLISTVITNNIKVYHLEKDCIPYAGIYITAKGRLPISEAKKILESKDFFDYAKEISINTIGNSMRISPKDINNFLFSIK